MSISSVALVEGIRARIFEYRVWGMWGVNRLDALRFGDLGSKGWDTRLDVDFSAGGFRGEEELPVPDYGFLHEDGAGH